jgi:hypothetical protein
MAIYLKATAITVAIYFFVGLIVAGSGNKMTGLIVVPALIAMHLWYGRLDGVTDKDCRIAILGGVTGFFVFVFASVVIGSLLLNG